LEQNLEAGGQYECSGEGFVPDIPTGSEQGVSVLVNEDLDSVVTNTQE